MIEAQNLTWSFNGHIARSDLNLRLESGELFCLLGANGTGRIQPVVGIGGE